MNLYLLAWPALQDPTMQMCRDSSGVPLDCICSLVARLSTFSYGEPGQEATFYRYTCMINLQAWNKHDYRIAHICSGLGRILHTISYAEYWNFTSNNISKNERICRNGSDKNHAHLIMITAWKCTRIPTSFFCNVWTHIWEGTYSP